jgi:hypothetical protein
MAEATAELRVASAALLHALRGVEIALNLGIGQVVREAIGRGGDLAHGRASVRNNTLHVLIGRIVLLLRLLLATHL